MAFFTVLRKVVKDCLTENDGVSYCPFRISGFSMSIVGLFIFAGGSIYDIVTTGKLPLMEFAGAFSTMMTGISVLTASVAFKARTDTPGTPTA